MNHDKDPATALAQAGVASLGQPHRIITEGDGRNDHKSALFRDKRPTETITSDPVPLVDKPITGKLTTIITEMNYTIEQLYVLTGIVNNHADRMVGPAPAPNNYNDEPVKYDGQVDQIEHLTGVCNTLIGHLHDSLNRFDEI